MSNPKHRQPKTIVVVDDDFHTITLTQTPSMIWLEAQTKNADKTPRPHQPFLIFNQDVVPLIGALSELYADDLLTQEGER